ncbi:MAG TPA: nuclear transport factor 2 family protein [Chitinophaga sp.]|uniref:nuclear transport factor 2 family protein n=1 Tax=Chitinophaga sp. TaxID=1869181 RepID=UPI002DB95233|nr:nuclear transport factor 2 family protein [Chitinophaga sp.]HEU4554839.1 nuclear transport factor 2 family protein [Chitinophaga sp.]
MTTQTSTMTTQAIATRLAELCRKGEFETAQDELYADDAVSIEPYATEDFPKETAGREALKEKGEKFQSMVEAMHSEPEISEPLVAGNSFAITMTMDMTMKQKGRMKMTELCVYKVKDGKIVSEEFFM